MVVMISYDLNGHERPSAYEAVRKVIERDALSFKRPLYSQWFVETRESPQVWYEKLEPVIDKDDKVFICQIRPPRQGNLGKPFWDWLKPRE
jgi:hypothetical protein